MARNIANCFSQAEGVVVVTVLSLKVVAYALLYAMLRSEAPWHHFCAYAWDAGWYADIAKTWYPPRPDAKYAFFPLHPSMVRAIWFITKVKFTYIATGTTLVASCLAFLAYYLVARRYLGEKHAIYSTLLFASFPSVYIFTTASYAEPWLLFFWCLTWILYLKESVLSGITGALAAVTRPPGILIVVPPSFDLIHCIRRRKQPKLYQIIAVLGPILGLLGWEAYIWIRSGDPFVFFYAQSLWGYRRPFWVFATLSSTGTLEPFKQEWQRFEVYPYLLLLVLITVLLGKNSKLEDPRLRAFVYASIAFFVLFGSVDCFSRHLFFIFPIWFVLRTDDFGTFLLLFSIFLAIGIAILPLFFIGCWMG
ncbi:hypothetical protein DRN94_002255 [archaeon]|nr:hypothetical protein [archaeon]